MEAECKEKCSKCMDCFLMDTDIAGMLIKAGIDRNEIIDILEPDDVQF